MKISEDFVLEISGQHLAILPQKALFWQEQKALLLADVHAGKASHFRKNGIPLSTDLLLNDLNKIEILLKKTLANKLIILGDLFHSSSNIENTLVENWVDGLGVSTELVLGNHDIHSLANSRIPTKLPYVLDGILLSHEPTESEHLNIHGHLHPAFTLAGKARSQLKLPAYYINEQYITLPAFGSTTGQRMYAEMCKNSRIILVTDDGLLAAN